MASPQPRALPPKSTSCICKTPFWPSFTKPTHALTESTAVTTTDLTTRKQLVLADLSLHLVQAALRHTQPDPAELKRYLYSILTVCDAFVSDLDLKAMANVVLPPPK